MLQSVARGPSSAFRAADARASGCRRTTYIVRIYFETSATRESEEERGDSSGNPPRSAFPRAPFPTQILTQRLIESSSGTARVM